MYWASIISVMLYFSSWVVGTWMQCFSWVCMCVCMCVCVCGVFFFFEYLSILKIFFSCRAFLKSLFNLLTIFILFYVLVFWPQGRQDLSSPTRDRTCDPCIARQSLNHWAAREVPADFTQMFWLNSPVRPTPDHSQKSLDQMKWVQWMGLAMTGFSPMVRKGDIWRKSNRMCICYVPNERILESLEPCLNTSSSRKCLLDK